MHEEYKRLMQQQYPMEDASLFFEEAKAAPTKRTPVYKKILIAAACLCLLIPSAVLAAENIFDISIVHTGPRKDWKGNDVIGYNIDFVTTKEIPLGEFAEKWQHIDESIPVRYDTWQELQADMGYDLLENPVLETNYQPYTPLLQFQTEGLQKPIRCAAFYRGFEGQLWSFNASAGYIKGDYKITLTAEALVEHPNIPEDVKGVFTAVQYLLDDESDLEHFSTEEYTASSGLTATLLTYDWGNNYFSYDAYFRANGVRYNVSMDACRKDLMPEAKERMIEILEAFTME
jgi:hypothetical protein